MDYEYYDALFSELTDDDAFEQCNIVTGLHIYEDMEAEWLIMPAAPIVVEFNLFYGEDPSDGVYRWMLHYPEAE